jgi:hypothetical protein
MRWTKLLRKLWHDDCGAVITAEYMMVFGIMAMGAAQGLSALRDTATTELHETGNAVREARLHYTPQVAKSRNQQPGGALGAPSTPTVSPCPGGVCP